VLSKGAFLFINLEWRGSKQLVDPFSLQDVSFIVNSPLSLFSDISVLAVLFVFSACRHHDGPFGDLCLGKYKSACNKPLIHPGLCPWMWCGNFAVRFTHAPTLEILSGFLRSWKVRRMTRVTTTLLMILTAFPSLVHYRSSGSI
jgi:hypothetical protein